MFTKLNWTGAWAGGSISRFVLEGPAIAFWFSAGAGLGEEDGELR